MKGTIQQQQAQTINDVFTGKVMERSIHQKITSARPAQALCRENLLLQVYRAAESLAGLHVLHIDTTAQGGRVAELLHHHGERLTTTLSATFSFAIDSFSTCNKKQHDRKVKRQGCR